MHGWIEQTEQLAQTDTQRTALIGSASDRLSYGSLVRRMDLLGSWLRAHGLHRGSRVATLLPPGIDSAIAQLALMRHAVCVPLNPHIGTAELMTTLKRAGAAAVLMPAEGAEHLVSIAGTLGLQVLGLRRNRASDEPGPQLEYLVPPLSVPQPCAETLRASDDPSLILHTSGSTGEAKRVVLSHAQLNASAHNLAQHLRLQPDDIALNVMPLFHSHGLVGVLLSSLSVGASVAVLEGFNPQVFFEAVGSLQPTWYSARPTIHISVLEHLPMYRAQAPQHRFRFIRSTSSALPEPILHRLETAFDAPVIESFGMTEWSQMASNPLPPGRRKVGSVGQATGVELALLQDGQELRALHATDGWTGMGELLVRGDGLAKGYDGDAVATESAWIHGWFRTGDMARVDEDGYIHMVGRLKELINRGGEKISPLEIEAVLLTHPAVHDAVAFGVSHPTLGEDVAAAVSLQPEQSTSESALREFLLDRLAAFKVPSQVVIRSAIPRSATGKVKRSELALELEGHSAGTPDTPLTSTERAIAEIWCAVLKRDSVSASDNFFALGGDSLSGMRVIGRINKQLGVKLQPSKLFRHPSLRELAAVVTPPSSTPAARLEEQIQNLSDADVERLLALEEQRALAQQR